MDIKLHRPVTATCESGWVTMVLWAGEPAVWGYGSWRGQPDIGLPAQAAIFDALRQAAIAALRKDAGLGAASDRMPGEEAR